MAKRSSPAGVRRRRAAARGCGGLHPIENLEHLAEASLCLGDFHPLTTSERIRCKAQGLGDLCLSGPQRAHDLRGREQARLRCKRRIESYSHLSSLISLSIVMGCDIATGVPGGRFFGIDWWRWYQGGDVLVRADVRSGGWGGWGEREAEKVRWGLGRRLVGHGRWAWLGWPWVRGGRGGAVGSAV
jgi:hypothetical protein